MNIRILTILSVILSLCMIAATIFAEGVLKQG
jgi:hypothetical protein